MCLGQHRARADPIYLGQRFDDFGGSGFGINPGGGPASFPYGLVKPIAQYQRRFRHDIDDLLTGFDRAMLRLSECTSMVKSAKSNLSCGRDGRDDGFIFPKRPARAGGHAPSGSDLVITATPEGRIVRLRPAPATGLRADDLWDWSEGRPGPYDYVHALTAFQADDGRSGGSMIFMAVFFAFWPFF